MIVTNKTDPKFLMHVARYRDLFLETGNPLYAWRAFHNAIAVKCPVPEEVIDYLMNAAREIVKIAQDAPKPSQRPIALAKALKLHKNGAGQGSAFHEYSTHLESREIALGVLDSEYYNADSLDYAFEDVSKKWGKSKATVRRIFLAHSDRWQKTAKELIDSGAVQKTPEGWDVKLRVFGNADDFREAAAIIDEIKRM